MILVTGITGFLGRHLAARLIERGEKVIGLARTKEILKIGSFDIAVFSSYDVDFSLLFKNYDVKKIVHCATDYGRVTGSSSDIYRSNYTVPKAIFDTANKTGSDIFINCESFLQKGSSVGRNSAYISSKNKFRNYASNNPGVVRYISLQLEHMYGPHDNPSKLIPHIVNSAINGSSPIELGNCNVLRDLIHVTDVVSAFEVVLDKHRDISETVLEVGSGRSVDLREAVHLLLQIINGRSGPGAKDVKVVFSEEKSEQLYQSAANIAVLRRYGWSPRIAISSGFNDVIDAALYETAKLS